MEWRNVKRRIFPRRAIESDVREEIAFHIEERVRELVAGGWAEEDARRVVIERFGDVGSVEEACRAYDAQRVNRESWRMMMEMWWRDLRFAVRGLRRDPVFTLIVLTTLSLGIGATTSVFSVLEAVVLRDLPFPEADRLAVVWQNDRATGTEREAASTSDYFDYVERTRTFSALALHAAGPVVLLREGAPPLQLDGAVVSGNLLGVLGREPQIGRGFTEAEDQPDGPPAVMLSDHVWHGQFGGDPAIVGRSLVIDDVPHEVVGVLPAGLDFPAAQTDVWIPIRQAPTIATRQNHWVRVVGRLRPDATVAAAQADMSRIMAELEEEYPEANTNRGAFVEPLADVGRGDIRRTLWVLFGAVLAVLAIACVNVANLLLARGATRTRELAVLTAIGAGARQVARRFFVEGLVLTGLAAAAGMAIAAVGVRLLMTLAPEGLTALGTPAVNPAVLAFTAAVAVLICLVFAFLPAVQLGRLDVQKELKDGRSTSVSSAGLGVRRLLVVGQLSLAVVLLLGASLLIGTVRNLRAIDPGFVAESTLRMDFPVPERVVEGMDTWPDWPEAIEFVRRIEDGAASLPGVTAASVVLNHPLDPGFTNSFQIEGRAYDPNQGEITTRMVTPSYFETSGLSLVRGRLLDDADRVDTPPVIVLNETAAARYFPGEDPIGRRIAFWGPNFREIVGIVADEKLHGLTRAAPPALYLTVYQAPPRPGQATVMIRADVPPTTLADAMREVMRGIDPDVPLFNVATMEATLADAMARERFASTLLSIFAVVAVILSVLGVHGVLSYLVSQRGHEVGVRLALGATRRDVVRMIVGQGASMTLLGVVLGLAVAFGISGLLQSLLFGVDATSPGAYLATGGALLVVALAATALPARRAASIDPVGSLRSD